MKVKKIVTSVPFAIVIVVLGVLWMILDTILLQTTVKSLTRDVSFDKTRSISSLDGNSITFVNYNLKESSQMLEYDIVNNEIQYMYSDRKWNSVNFIPNALKIEDGSYYIIEVYLDCIESFFGVSYIEQYMCHLDKNGKIIEKIKLPGIIGNYNNEILYSDGNLYLCQYDRIDDYDFTNRKYSISDEEELLNACIYRVNFEQGEYEAIGDLEFSKQSLSRIEAKNGCFFAYFADGGLGKISINGEYETLVDTSEEVEQKRVIISAAYIADELYAMAGDLGDELVRIVDGKIQFICNLSEILPDAYNDEEAYKMTENPSTLFSYGDKIGLKINTYFGVIDKEGNPIAYSNHVELPKKYQVSNTLLKIFISARPYIMLVLGIILLLGNLIKWKTGLLFKNLLVVPIAIVLVILIVQICLMVAQSCLLSEQDEVLLYRSKWLAEAIDYDELEGDLAEASKNAYNQIQKVAIRNPNLFNGYYNTKIYKKLSDNEWIRLYDSRSNSTVSYSVGNHIPLEKMDKIETTYYMSQQGKGSYFFTLLYDNQGEEAGLVLAYEVDNNFIMNEMGWLSFAVALPTLIVIIVIIVQITKLSLRNIMKVREGIEYIGSGDYSYRLAKISTDELGDIGDGINYMAERIQKTQDSIITGMATMVEKRDCNTGGHIKRTSLVVKVFSHKLLEHAEEFGVDAKFLYNVEKAAPMHDMGKITVDDAILRKNGRFTDEEYAVMKSHSLEGGKIVSEVLEEIDDEEFVRVATNVANFHHEKWNGEGYPNHIAAEEIPIEARIMALADVFDALVSKRCYKDSMEYDKAFDIIRNDLGTHFDPKLGALFLECRPELEKLYNNIEH